ncbi:MAG: hypothetical protein JOZ07_18675 [Solirubrobacterales bacterium]|nr:hypothetical protein [Solirubrobacterales bacterium]
MTAPPEAIAALCDPDDERAPDEPDVNDDPERAEALFASAGSCPETSWTNTPPVAARKTAVPAPATRRRIDLTRSRRAAALDCVVMSLAAFVRRTGVTHDRPPASQTDKKRVSETYEPRGALVGAPEAAIDDR